MRKLTPIYSMVNFVDDAHFRRVWKHPKKTITTKQRAWVQYMMSVWGRVNRGDMLSMEDVLEILRIKLVGVIPEDQSVLRASNQGEPVILDINADAGKAYADTVDRLLGEERPFRFIEEEKKGFLKRLFGG